MWTNEGQSCLEIPRDWKPKDLCGQTRGKVVPRSNEINMN